MRTLGPSPDEAQVRALLQARLQPWRVESTEGKADGMGMFGLGEENENEALTTARKARREARRRHGRRRQGGHPRARVTRSRSSQRAARQPVALPGPTA